MKWLVLFAALALFGACARRRPGPFMYVGTLDKKLLVIDEDKEEVVDEIPLNGIPRTTVLSADHKKLHIITTQMLLETVDLETRKVVSSFSLGDPRSKLRFSASAPDRSLRKRHYSRLSGLAVDPTGRYLYTTMRWWSRTSISIASSLHSSSR